MQMEKAKYMKSRLARELLSDTIFFFLFFFLLSFSFLFVLILAATQLPTLQSKHWHPAVCRMWSVQFWYNLLLRWCVAFPLYVFFHFHFSLQRYACLITWAIRDAEGERIKLEGIYTWIMDR